MVPNFSALFTAIVRDFFTLDPRRVDWKRTAILVLIVLLVASVLWHRFMPQLREINTTIFKAVPQVKVLRDVQRVYVPCPERGLVVLDKRQTAERLDLPLRKDTAAPGLPPGMLSAGEVLSLNEGTIQGSHYSDDDSQFNYEILASAEVPETRNGVEVLAVLDTGTGVTTPVIREKPAPWFQFRNDGALGVRYGVDERLQPIGSVYGRYDFLRIKDLYFSATGAIETDGDAALQLGAEYRW